MSDYWQERQHLRYYRRVRELIEQAQGESICDVGSGGTPVALWGDFHVRHSISLHNNAEPPAGVEHHTMDFMASPLHRQYDVVTCLQVLEHLDQPRAFAQRLLQAFNRTLIVSVPWHWPKGRCKYHTQDPVTEDKIRKWFGKPWDEQEVVVDGGMERAIFIWHQTQADSL